MIAYNQLEVAPNPMVAIDSPFAGPCFKAFQELAKQAKKHGSLLVG